MTGYSDLPTPERTNARGIRQILLKPASVQTLAAAVHAAILPPLPA